MRPVLANMQFHKSRRVRVFDPERKRCSRRENFRGRSPQVHRLCSQAFDLCSHPCYQFLSEEFRPTLAMEECEWLGQYSELRAFVRQECRSYKTTPVVQDWR